MGITRQSVQRKIKKGKYTTEDVVANGGAQYRIRVDSLEPEYQAKYFKSIQSETKQEKPVALSTAPTDLNLPNPKLKEIGLGYHTFYELVKKRIDHRYGYKLSSMENACEFARTELPKYICGYKMKYNSDKYRECCDTLKENNNDPFSLIPDWSGKGSSVAKEVADVLLRLVLNPNRPKIAEVIRNTIKVLKSIDYEDIPKPRIMRNFLNKWKKENFDIWVQMRRGTKALNDKIVPDIFRDYDKIGFGDIIVIDGHTLNLELLDSVTGKPKRMTFIVGMDMKTGMIVGFEIALSENIMAIASCIRRITLNLGCVARCFYLDNSRAARSKYIKGIGNFKNTIIPGLIEKLGSRITYAWPYHGQSKTIERFFGILAELERNSINYIGTSIKDKPARLMRNEKFHIELHNKITNGKILTIPEFIYLLDQWLKEYHDRPGQSGRMKGISPNELKEKSLPIVKALPDFQQRLISEDQLNFLMMETKVKTLQKNGIRLFGKYYFNDCLYTLEKTTWNFLIKYDMFDLGSILVYDVKGKFICRAKCTSDEKVHPMAKLGTDQDRELLKSKIAQKRHYYKQTEQACKALINESPVKELPVHVPAHLYKPEHGTVELENNNHPNYSLLNPEKSEPKNKKSTEPDYSKWATVLPEKPKKKYFAFAYEKLEYDLKKAAGDDLNE